VLSHQIRLAALLWKTCSTA